MRGDDRKKDSGYELLRCELFPLLQVCAGAERGIDLGRYDQCAGGAEALLLFYGHYVLSERVEEGDREGIAGGGVVEGKNPYVAGVRGGDGGGVYQRGWG